MAELETIRATLRADTAQFSSSMSGATKVAAGLAVALGAVAAVQFAKGVISSGKKFESAISDLSAITGATGKDLKFLSDKSKEFGATTTLSAIQAAEAFKLVASAKPDLLENAEALAKVTKEAITLAEASGSTLPQAAKTLGSALNQFNADAEESTRFINVLAAGAKFGASEIAETALALKQSGAVAANAGVSFEELNAAIQSLSTVSIKGGEAGTGLRNVLLKLQTQSNDKLNPAIVGLSAALANLGKENLSTEEKTKLFGLENVVVADTLIKEAKNLDTLTAKLTGTNTAYEQASIKVDNLEGDILKLGSVFEALQITLSQKTNPGLRANTQALADVFNALNTAAEGADNADKSFLDFSSSIKTIANVFAISAKEIADFGDLIGAAVAIAVEATRGNKEGIDTIIAARKEHRAAVDDEISAFISNVEGTKKSTDTNIENKKSIDEISESLRKKTKAQLASSEVESIATPANELGPSVGPEQQAVGDNEALLEQLDSRLEIIRESLLTEQELLIEAHEAQLEDLEASIENKLLTEEEAGKRSEQIQKKHDENLTKLSEKEEKRRAQLRTFQQRQNLKSTSSFLSDIVTLTSDGSKREFKIAKAASKAIAVIKGIESVQSAFAAGAKIHPIVGAAFAAAAALVAAKNVSAIGSASFGGGGGIPSGGGGGGGSTQAPSIDELQTAQPEETTATARQVRQDVTINLGAEDDELISTSAVRNLMEKINEQIDDGVAIGSITIS